MKNIFFNNSTLPVPNDINSTINRGEIKEVARQQSTTAELKVTHSEFKSFKNKNSRCF